MRWYVLQVLTGKEAHVCEKLMEEDLYAAVPQESRLIRTGGRWIKKLYTLFAGYVFIHIKYCAELYYKISAVPGVIGFLKSDNEPVALTYIEAEYMKQLINNGQPIQPAVIRFDGTGRIKEINGVMGCFRSRIVKYDRHARKARINISIGGMAKEIELSAIAEDDLDSDSDSDSEDSKNDEETEDSEDSDIN